MKNWVRFSLPVATLFVLSCGNARHLQSISVSQTVNGAQIAFVATGTFTAPPTTVTPLPVDWMLGIPAPPPKQWTYTLTNQPYIYNCLNLNSLNPGQITAFAPGDPNAPPSGTTNKVVTGSLAWTCQ